MTSCSPIIFAAPLQGYTDAAWRKFHSELFPGAVDRYFTPFLRLEKGEIRRQDLKGLVSELNSGVRLTPQIIFRDVEEFRTLCDSIRDNGMKVIDLNLGCPFPPQVKHGRGAALLRNPLMLGEIGDVIKDEYNDIVFSAKIRLGVERTDEWRQVIDVLDRMPLSHITVHPRAAIQQYGGEPDMDELGSFLSASTHRIVYNGDIDSKEKACRIIEAYPSLYAIMIGRGLIANPSLPSEIKSGAQLDDSTRIAKMVALHSRLFSYYSETLCGDAQILSKIKPFWDYAEPLVDRKILKAIKKATSTSKYLSAIDMLQS